MKSDMPFELSRNHWSLSAFPFMQNVTTKQLRTILLNGNDRIFRAGRMAELKKKYLGAGVYRIWYETKRYL